MLLLLFYTVLVILSQLACCNGAQSYSIKTHCFLHEPGYCKLHVLMLCQSDVFFYVCTQYDFSFFKHCLNLWVQKLVSSDSQLFFIAVKEKQSQYSSVSLTCQYVSDFRAFVLTRWTGMTEINADRKQCRMRKTRGQKIVWEEESSRAAVREKERDQAERVLALLYVCVLMCLAEYRTHNSLGTVKSACICIT